MEAACRGPAPHGSKTEKKGQLSGLFAPCLTRTSADSASSTQLPACLQLDLQPGCSIVRNSPFAAFPPGDACLPVHRRAALGGRRSRSEVGLAGPGPLVLPFPGFGSPHALGCQPLACPFPLQPARAKVASLVAREGRASQSRAGNPTLAPSVGNFLGALDFPSHDRARCCKSRWRAAGELLSGKPRPSCLSVVVVVSASHFSLCGLAASRSGATGKCKHPLHATPKFHTPRHVQALHLVKSAGQASKDPQNPGTESVFQTKGVFVSNT